MLIWSSLVPRHSDQVGKEKKNKKIKISVTFEGIIVDVVMCSTM